jgi:5-formyltetrahydrofolate cyclo-ligase
MGQILESSTLATQKAALRAALKQIRASLSTEDRASASKTIMHNVLSLEEVKTARAVFIYISHGQEVDTHALLRHFLDRGVTVAVPKILPGKSMIAVRFDRWEDLTPGELGILTPSGNTPCPGPFDIVITPGLGFTVLGDRIGYGRGYYDKWFAEHRVGRKIALTFEVQVIAELPRAEYDIPVDVLITEKRIIVIS